MCVVVLVFLRFCESPPSVLLLLLLLLLLRRRRRRLSCFGIYLTASQYGF